MAILTRQVLDAGLDALDRIKRGDAPTAAMLADAPTLEFWAIEPLGDGIIRLVGVVHGHPTIDDGPCTTSPLLFVHASGAWARTISRYYRLGRSLSDAMSAASEVDHGHS